MGLFQIRTDLALEAKENMDAVQEPCRGISVEEVEFLSGEVKVTRVKVETKNGAKAMGKPMGTYITVEAPMLAEADEEHHKELSALLSDEIRSVLPDDKKEPSVLIVGLGNREVTADSLGPHVADHLNINRHMILEYGKAACDNERLHMVSALVPGVMAKTGMETAEIIKGVVEQTRPDFMIVIDALAARSMKRLNRTVQISNTGIQPGSGVGNHRHALTAESLGIPVVAVGVPTVVDAGTIVEDATAFILRDAGYEPQTMIHSVGPGMLTELNAMYVTSKDVDSQVEQIAHVLCDAINQALKR